MSRGEKITQLSVVVIAISAVAVSLWQGHMTQKHNKLSVRPYFDITVMRYGKLDSLHDFSVQLSNEGYGTAIIKEFVITAHGKEHINWGPALKEMGTLDRLDGTHNLTNGDVFASGKTLTLLELGGVSLEETRNWKIRITYQSIYQEEFTIEEEFK